MVIKVWIASHLCQNHPRCFTRRQTLTSGIWESEPSQVSQRNLHFSSVQSFSRVWLFATPWIAARQASLSITNSRCFPKLMPIESVMPSSHLILCRPLLLLPPIPPTVRVFSNESALRMRWPKYWSFSFSISPSNEHPGLISFRMDWLDLLAVQGTLKSLFQHNSSKASVFRHSAFFTVQLSHPYKTTGKTIALTRQTFVGKVMSLLFNMLSRLVITFLPRSKEPYTLWNLRATGLGFASDWSTHSAPCTRGSISSYQSTQNNLLFRMVVLRWDEVLSHQIEMKVYSE